ncbi:hypothetical protein ACLB1S_14000 [Escherichia coli]
MGVIVEAVREMLKNHRHQQQTNLTGLFQPVCDSSLNIMVYCFTKTTVWAEWLATPGKTFI